MGRTTRSQGTNVPIYVQPGVDLSIGQGAYCLRLAYFGQGNFLIRVPFIGKVWAFGMAGWGCMGWAAAKQEALAYGDD